MRVPSSISKPEAQPLLEKPATSPPPPPPPAHRSLKYNLKTLYLFTRSDLKTVLVSQTAFGLAGVLAGPGMSSSYDPHRSALSLALGVVRAIAWVWPNLLMFNISNQRRPDAVAEDALNKPWRPLPSGRVTTQEAYYMFLLVSALVFAWSYTLGGLWPSLSLALWTSVYNDMGMANSIFRRNLVNALGIMSFSSGAFQAAGGAFTGHGFTWVLITGAIVLTTIHSQDLPDIDGDRLRDRITVPIILGETFTRVSVIVMHVFWSIFCPLFWSLDSTPLSASSSLLDLLTPGTIAALVLANGVTLVMGLMYARGKGDHEVDDKVWKLWGLWMAVTYFVPSLVAASAGSR